VITRNDVARRAGVSTAVVSYVLNDGPRPVAPATRARVLEAISDLGYRPNGVARSLRTKRTRAIGLILPDIANSFFAQLSREVELAAFARGFTLLVGNAMDESARELLYAHAFVERRVDGVVVVSAGEDVGAIKVLAAADMALITIDRSVPGAGVSSVHVDNRHGGYLATKHLIEHGHRRIACLAGPDTVNNAVERRRGWEAALQEAGLSAPDGLAMASESFSREAAYRSTRKVLGRRNPPTAIFAGADEQALGVYRAAAATGRRVPDDLAVVSFDSAETAPYLVPGLTAVRQPVALMAGLAMDRLVAQLSDLSGPPTQDTLSVDLVVRGSCGCPDSEPRSG
jgi:LacI family transcriptional regulator